MKKFLFFASMMLATMCAQAQLTVASTGNTTTGTLTVNGVMGATGNYGALTVESDEVHEAWNSMSGGPLMVLCAKTSSNGVIPFSVYMNNTQMFYIGTNGYAYGKGFVNTSDSTRKENIANLQSPLQKLGTLHGISFNFKDENSSKQSRMRTMEVPLGATPEISAQIESEQNRKRIGLIAQEVEQVFPEVVRTQYDGTKGILYSDLIGVLVEAINDLQDSLTVQGTQIAALQNQMNAMQAVFFANNGSQPQLEQQGRQSNVDFSHAILYQNTPNPFKQETTIAYRLPSNIQNASLCIYNLNGQQLKKYDLDTAVISNSVTVEGSTLTAGMYIYALIIDGQMVASKRMVLTE